MKFKDVIAKIFTRGAYDPTWQCNACGRENFNGRFFCDECESELPYNKKAICDHCGRQVKISTSFCSTCKGVLVSVDKARSVFVYENPINKLLKSGKYYKGKYVYDYFAGKLSAILFSEFTNTEVVCSVPMSKERYVKRGYNQSEILAEKVSEITGVPFVNCLEKSKETVRQAKLGRADRLKNLIGSFKVTDKSAVRGKNVAIIDDVSTTGATGEAVAAVLKKAGALRVFLLTVASVPSKNGY